MKEKIKKSLKKETKQPQLQVQALELLQELVVQAQGQQHQAVVV